MMPIKPKYPVLVKFWASEHFITIRTRTRLNKSPQSFDLPRPSFTDLEADGHILVKDGPSFADFSLIDDGATVKIDFTWLSKSGHDAVHGFTQTVTLDYDTLANRLWDSLPGNDGPTRWSMLSVDRTKEQARFDFSSESAQRTIREIIAVPVLRHKLTRAVRDCFMWPNNGDLVIRFYADLDRYSFGFEEYVGGERRVCGGLILHHHDGLEKAKYSVHT